MRLIAKAIILGLLALFAAYHVTGEAREWTKQEKQWAAAALAVTAVDWAQTRYIAAHPDRFRELNPLLPDHPTLGQVNRHFVRSILITGLVAHLLPEYRLAILRTTAVLELGVTARNAYIGIGVKF